MLDDFQFVLDLGFNLFSVGKLMTDVYSLLFDDDACVITNKKSDKKYHITKTPNNMFCWTSLTWKRLLSLQVKRKTRSYGI